MAINGIKKKFCFSPINNFKSKYQTAVFDQQFLNFATLFYTLNKEVW